MKKNVNGLLKKIGLILGLSLTFSSLVATPSPASATDWWVPANFPFQNTLDTYNSSGPIDESEVTNSQAFDEFVQLQAGPAATTVSVELAFYYATFVSPNAACTAGVDLNVLTCGDFTVTVVQPSGNPYTVTPGSTVSMTASDLPNLLISADANRVASVVRLTLSSFETPTSFSDVYILIHVPANTLTYPSAADKSRGRGGKTMPIGAGKYDVSKTRADQLSQGYSYQSYLYFGTDRTLTWAPNTGLLLASSPVTPSAAPILSAGAGAMSYSVDPSSTSDCTVNVSTGEMTYTTVGTCVVKLNVATNAGYLQKSQTKTFTITDSPPAPTATFTTGEGSGTAPTVASGDVASAPDSTGLIAPTGKSFAGWSCTPNGGSASSVAAGASLAVAVDTVCIAQWSANSVYKISFSTGSGAGTAPADSDGPQLLPSQGGMVAPAGKYFTGWSCVPGGVKGVGASITPTANTLCTAVWAPYVTPTHKVVFKGNGGVGSMPNQIRGTAGKLVSNKFVRGNQKFAGWNTKADGSGVSFANRANFEFAADTTLFAQWRFQSRQIVTTFAGDKPNLQSNMKATITKWLAKLPKGVRVMCLGSTSGAKITSFDKKLAFNRANNVCTYATHIRKDIKFSIKLNPSSDTAVGARHVWMYYNY